jgi:hypothetical protein
MRTKKITVDISTNSLTEAVGQCNLVFEINKKRREIEELKKEVKRLSKKDKFVLFSEQVNFKIIEAATSNESCVQRNFVIDKIEISPALYANSSDDFYSFFLKLNLYRGVYVFSFLFAKNKGGNAGYLVQTENDELLIMDGGNGRVKFSSVDDFQRVIKFCDEYLAKFNSFLEDEKLIPHFNEPIFVFD